MGSFFCSILFWCFPKICSNLAKFHSFRSLEGRFPKIGFIFNGYFHIKPQKESNFQNKMSPPHRISGSFLRKHPVYIYICCHASSGTTFLHFHKLMCGTRLRIAPLQFLKWPHLPHVFWVHFWKFKIKEAPERPTPKVNEWPHFWPFFPKRGPLHDGGAVHSLTSSRRPFLAHFSATLLLIPNPYFYRVFDRVPVSKANNGKKTRH